MNLHPAMLALSYEHYNYRLSTDPEKEFFYVQK